MIEKKNYLESFLLFGFFSDFFSLETSSSTFSIFLISFSELLTVFVSFSSEESSLFLDFLFFFFGISPVTLILIGCFMSLWIFNSTSYSPTEFTLERMEIFFLWISKPFSFNIFDILLVVTDPNNLSSDPVLSLNSRTRSPIFLANFWASLRISSCFFAVCFKFSSKTLLFDLLDKTPKPWGI